MCSDELAPGQNVINKMTLSSKVCHLCIKIKNIVEIEIWI